MESSRDCVYLGYFGDLTGFNCPECNKFLPFFQINHSYRVEDIEFSGYLSGINCIDCDQKFFSFDALIEFEEAMAAYLVKIAPKTEKALRLIKRATSSRIFYS